VRKDPFLAAQWFLRAANLGLADSQFDLGVLYERGLGLPQSLKEAYKWYAIAAAQGDAESRTRMQAIASHLRAGDKRAAGRAAANFHPAPLGAAANIPPIAASLIGG
jgi:localization factor PodJL